jgi:CHAT domain-containing protein/tetratricopeptide (TPR) repeat protein
MQSLLNVGLAAFVSTTLVLVSPSIVSAQPADGAAELSRQVIELLNAGRYAEAIPLAQRALAIREKTLGPFHPDLATSLNDLAVLYYNQGRYGDAEPLYKRALSIREKALGRAHPHVALSMSNLGSLYESEGRYADAEPLYRRALAIREKALGREHPDVAYSLNSLARLSAAQGHYSEAERLYRRSLAIWEKALGPDDPDVAASLNNLAMLYQRQSRYAEAEPLYRRSLAIREKALGPDHPAVADSLNNLAVLYAEQARYADAAPLYQRSLAIREKTLGHDHLKVAESLDNLASFYERLGRYAEAEPLHQRALLIYENALGGDHPDVATALNNLALLHWKQGRYAEAEPLYRRALAIEEKVLGRDHPEVAQALNNLAVLYRAQGRYADAEPLYRRALSLREAALGGNHPDVATALNNLAVLYRAEHRYDDAEPLQRRALAILDKALGPDHPLVALSLNNLTVLYSEQGRYADALPLIERASQHGGASKGVALLVLLAARAQSLITPAQAFTQSYDIVQRASSSAAATAVSRLAARFAADSGELAQLVREDQDLAGEAGKLDKTVAAFVSRPPAERSAAGEQKIRERIEAVRTQREKLRQTFNQRFPDYVALSRPQPASLQETQAQLADDEALLVLDFDQRSYGWLVTRDGAEWKELNVAASDLDGQVAALRASITRQGSARFEPGLAYTIYQETFGAFASAIAGKQRLSIVTNGALTSLPPQLLVTGDPAGRALKEVDWLIRSHAITVLPSVASLKVLRGVSQVSAARKPMIAFADPVFSKHAQPEPQHVALRSIASFYRGAEVDIAALGNYLPPLPGTRKEVEEIAAELTAEPEDVRLGDAASETAVKQAKLDQYRIVYFATHGLVAGYLAQFASSKAEPALALSMPEHPSELDDGLLTASEVAQLKLDADWAVLSACDTAAEEKPGAEALSGLARAFFYAGARSLIVSHWNVVDKAAAPLMAGTFRALARDPTLSHGEALRQSMLAMIEAARSDAEADPRLWAPFVVVGEPAKPR